MEEEEEDNKDGEREEGILLIIAHSGKTGSFTLVNDMITSEYVHYV